MEQKDKFVKAAFSTDPRVIEWAKKRFEVDPSKQEMLVKAVERLYEMGNQGISPQAEWLADAKKLAERIGQAWDFNHQEPAEEVQREYADAVEKRSVKQAIDTVTSGPTFISRTRRVRNTALGLPVTTVTPYEKVQIGVQSHIPFRMKRLVLEDAVASCLDVLDVRIGNYSQFGNAEPISGSVFAARAFPLPLDSDTAHVYQLIFIVVQNTSPIPIEVRGALQGVSLED